MSRSIILVPAYQSIDPGCELTLQQLEQLGFYVWRSYNGSAIDYVRNELAQQAIDQGFEDIYWVDSDIIFSVEHIQRLKSHQKPIVSGLYASKDSSKNLIGKLLPTSQIDDDGLLEMEYTGCGLLYTQAKVYSSIVKDLKLPLCTSRNGASFHPWFMPIIQNGIYYPEDTAFCIRARQVGYHILGDVNVKVGHVGKTIFSLDRKLSAYLSMFPAYYDKMIWPSSRINFTVVLISDGVLDNLLISLQSIQSLLNNRIKYNLVVTAPQNVEPVAFEGPDNILLLNGTYPHQVMDKLQSQNYDFRSYPGMLFLNAGDALTLDRIKLVEKLTDKQVPNAFSGEYKVTTGIYHYEHMPKLASKYTQYDDFLLYDAYAHPDKTQWGISYLKRFTADADEFRTIIAGDINDIQEENDIILAKKLDTTYERIWNVVTEVPSKALPGEPFHYNPSMLQLGDQLWMFYRHDVWENPKRLGWLAHQPTRIRAVQVTENLEPIKSTDHHVTIPTELSGLTFEDPRVVIVNGRIWMTVAEPTWDDGIKGWTSIREVLCELTFEDGKFKVIKTDVIKFGKNPQEEKNWVPFDYDNELFINYSVNPHLVFSYDHPELGIKTQIDFVWPFGDPHGGTPPIKVDNEYISFFHSRSRKLGFNIYCMGAYAFEAKYPFKVTRYTKRPLMYSNPVAYKLWNTSCIFPAGAIYNGKEWLVSYGWNDSTCRFTIISHDKLEKELVA